MSSESLKPGKKDNFEFPEVPELNGPPDHHETPEEESEKPRPISSISTMFVGIIVIAMLGSYLAFLAEADKDRDPATAYDITESVTPIVMDSSKMLAPLQIHLEHGSIPEDSEGDLQIDAHISTSMPTLDEVSYEWQLPEGVHLVAGIENDELVGLKSGHPLKISIVVGGFSKEKAQIISFHAHTETGKSKLSQSALITSRPEDFSESTAVKKMQAVIKSEKGKKGK